MKIRSFICGLFAIAAVAACKPDEVVETPALDVDKESVSLAAEAGEASFNVTTNQDWTASADADWVSVDPASGKASEKAVTVKVTAEDNTSEEVRTAKITVKAGELTRTVSVSQAAAQGEEPAPELELSEWALVGSFNNWDPKSTAYLSVLDDNYFVYYGFELETTTEFKFLKGGVWPPEGQEVGGNGLVQPNTIQPAGGSNIKVTEAGKYDIYLAADLSKFYVMTEGKLPSEAVEPAPVENSWGLMGNFVDNVWVSDIPMTQEGEWIVAKGAQFTELTFKIRANGSWSDPTNIGVAPGSEKGLVNAKISVVTAEYSKANFGGADAADIKLDGEAGTYDVYFSFDRLEVYVMEQGYKPGEKEPQTPVVKDVTYTVTGTIAGTGNYWNNSAEAGLMTLEGDYYVAKNLTMDLDMILNPNGTNPEEAVKFKICETGSWDGAYGQGDAAARYTANAEIPVVAGGSDIYIDKPGTYDVYFDKENGKVWVMTAGYKPGEEVASLDGKQWIAEVDGMQLLLDVGLYEEGALVMALPAMDGNGFAMSETGTYIIDKIDNAMGMLLFSKYDYEADEFMEEIEVLYESLTTKTVSITCEELFGIDTPVSFTLVETPYEIDMSALDGGSSPSGEVEDGAYWFIEPTNQKVLTPLGETASYGRPSAADAIDGASTAKNAFTLTYNADWTCYTIQDSYGRYLYSSMQSDGITPYRTLSVAETLPAADDENLAYYMWTVYNNGNGTYDVYNAATYYSISYSASYNNWEIYDPYADDFSNLFPALVKADNPVEEPEPEIPVGDAALFASNVTFTTVSSSYTDGVATVNDVADVATLKFGTSKKYGEATITIPAGTTKVTYYAVGWKNYPAKLEFSVGGTVIGTQEVAANDGATGNSPYTMTVTESDHYTFNVPITLEADTAVTVKTIETGYRAIVFGVKAE